jgi:hypothetical protein
MEEIINHLYSDKNLTKLSKKLASLVDDFGNTEEAMKYCKIWLKKKMQYTLEINKNNIKRGGDKIDLIKKINTDCLKTALDEYRKKTNSRNPTSINKYKNEREIEVYGNRKNRLEERPIQRDARKEKDGFGTVNDIGGFASFSSIDTSKGEFIRADGSVGDRMFFGNLNDDMQMGDKRSAKDDLERRMMMRKTE